MLCFYRPFLTSLRNTNDLLGTWFLKLLDFGSTINSATLPKAIPIYEVFLKWPIPFPLLHGSSSYTLATNMEIHFIRC